MVQYWIQWIPYSKCLTLLNTERYFQESSFPDHSHFKVYGLFHYKKLVVSPTQCVPGCRYSGYVYLVLETNHKRQPERKPDQIIHNLQIWTALTSGGVESTCRHQTAHIMHTCNSFENAIAEILSHMSVPVSVFWIIMVEKQQHHAQSLSGWFVQLHTFMSQLPL